MDSGLHPSLEALDMDWTASFPEGLRYRLNSILPWRPWIWVGLHPSLEAVGESLFSFLFLPQKVPLGPWFMSNFLQLKSQQC